jgi:hypothetical protein
MDSLVQKALVVPNLDSVVRRKTSVCLHLGVSQSSPWASAVKVNLPDQKYLLMELVVG